MTLVHHEPTVNDPAAHEAEALIKEARQRQRKRRLLVGMAVVVVPAASVTWAVVSRGTPRRPRSVATTGPLPTTAPARCVAQSLGVETLGVQTQLGWNYEAFLMHNLRAASCSVLAGPPTLRPYKFVGGRRMFLPDAFRPSFSCARIPYSALNDCGKVVVLGGHGYASFGIAVGLGTGPCERSNGFLIRLAGVTGTVNVPGSDDCCGTSLPVGALLSGCSAQQMDRGNFILITGSSSDARLAGCRLVKE
jgi:hypothetical protein